MFKHQWTCDS